MKRRGFLTTIVAVLAAPRELFRRRTRRTVSAGSIQYPALRGDGELVWLDCPTGPRVWPILMPAPDESDEQFRSRLRSVYR